jgi:hypothetical protein
MVGQLSQLLSRQSNNDRMKMDRYCFSCILFCTCTFSFKIFKISVFDSLWHVSELFFHLQVDLIFNIISELLEHIFCDVILKGLS